MGQSRLRVGIVLMVMSSLLMLPGIAAAEPIADTTFAEAPFVPGQVIVTYWSDSDAVSRSSALDDQDGEVIQEIPSINAQLVELPKGESVEDAIEAFEADPNVRYAEPNYVGTYSETPNDEYYGLEWGLNNTGQVIGNTGAGTAGVDISAEEAWDITTGDGSVIVGVLDSGIDPNHPDLVPNLWHAPAGWSLNGCLEGSIGYDAGGLDCDPRDVYGHGTHVSGTIGPTGNNTIRVAGVNWDVQIMMLAVGTNAPTAAAFAAGIDYAVQAKALGVNIRVLNASLSINLTQAVQDSMIAANAAGILLVTAAGNDTSNNDVNPSYPASFDLPNIISVAATDKNDALASFSNYGATSVDLGAPGVSIASTVPTYAHGMTTATSYAYVSGTSMASPHVAGVAALILSAPGLGDLSVAQLRERLLACGDPIASLNGKTVTGMRLNAHRSITGDGCIDVTPPAITISTDASDTVAVTGWYNIDSSGTDGVEVEVAATDIAGVANITCVDNGTLTVLNVSAGNGSFILGDGLHSIVCTATDTESNTGAGPGSTTMPVTYQVDQAAPTLVNMPADITQPTDPASDTATVSWTNPTATDNVDPNPTIQCAPPSGSVFATGSTDVTCTTTDAAGNAASDAFTVTVGGPDLALDDLYAMVESTPISGSSSVVTSVRRTLLAMVVLAQGLEDQDQTGLTCLQLQRLSLEIRSQVAKRRITPANSAPLYTRIDEIRTMLGCGGTR